MILEGSDFSGVGASDQAFMQMGIPTKKAFACDMDEYARHSYIFNYGTDEDRELVLSKEHSVISKKMKNLVEKNELFDEKHIEFLEYANKFANKFSFYYPWNVYNREIPAEPLGVYVTTPPCQAFSIAGKQKGKLDKRGILFFNSHEFIKINKPRYFIFENVKGLLSDDGGKTFQEWINLLAGKTINGMPVIFPYDDAVPYHLYWEVLNAKKHGVPQNRERVFLIGIRDDADNSFQFPREEHLFTRLKDILEDNVDDKYYLSDKMVQQLLNKNNDNSNGFGYSIQNEDSICPTVISGGTAPKDSAHIVIVGNTNPSSNGMNGNVFDSNGISPTLSTNKGEGIKVKVDQTQYEIYCNCGCTFIGCLSDKCPDCNSIKSGYTNEINIKIKSATKKGFEIATENDSINFSVPTSKTRRGRVGKGVGKGVAQTLCTACNQGVMVGDFRKDEVLNHRENGNNPTIIVHNLVGMVNVRKFSVDMDALKKVIKEHRNMSANKIAKLMNVPKTTVEHWFRTDSSFSIPDKLHWPKLKEILGITTTEFDESIMTFEEKEGVFEKSNRAYGIEGIAPTLTSTSSDEKICIPDSNPMVVKMKRPDEVKVKRKAELKSTGKDTGSFSERQVELENQDFSDTLLASPNPKKDGLICVPVLTPDRPEKRQNGRRFKDDGEEMFTITTQDRHGVFDGFKIRRLTPRECFRLMAFPDEFIFAVSDSQLYKQAGNSVVVRMFVKLYKQLKIQN